MTRMTTEEARERIAQRDAWEALCLRCSIPGIGNDHSRYYAARSLGAWHHEWRLMAMRSMPAPTAEDLKRWSALADYAREMRDVHARGIERAHWDLVRQCVTDTPQQDLERRLLHYVQQLTYGEDVATRAARDASAYTQAVIMAHEEDHA